MISSSLYQRVEFTFPAPGDLAGLNPFDTRDICLRGVMTDPQGTPREVCGFADRDHRLDPVPGNPKAIERASATGPLVFRARVSASVAGRHDVKLWYEFRDGRRSEVETVAFEAVPGNHPGHVRLGANGYSFATEDGNPFYPIGSNLCWPNLQWWDTLAGQVTQRETRSVWRQSSTPNWLVMTVLIGFVRQR